MQTQPSMIGADTVIGWVDNDNKQTIQCREMIVKSTSGVRYIDKCSAEAVGDGQKTSLKSIIKFKRPLQSGKKQPLSLIVAKLQRTEYGISIIEGNFFLMYVSLVFVTLIELADGHLDTIFQTLQQAICGDMDLLMELCEQTLFAQDQNGLPSQRIGITYYRCSSMSFVVYL